MRCHRRTCPTWRPSPAAFRLAPLLLHQRRNRGLLRPQQDPRPPRRDTARCFKPGSPRRRRPRARPPRGPLAGLLLQVNPIAPPAALPQEDPTVRVAEPPVLLRKEAHRRLAAVVVGAGPPLRRWSSWLLWSPSTRSTSRRADPIPCRWERRGAKNRGTSSPPTACHAFHRRPRPRRRQPRRQPRLLQRQHLHRSHASKPPLRPLPRQRPRPQRRRRSIGRRSRSLTLGASGRAAGTEGRWTPN